MIYKLLNSEIFKSLAFYFMQHYYYCAGNDLSMNFPRPRSDVIIFGQGLGPGLTWYINSQFRLFYVYQKPF